MWFKQIIRLFFSLFDRLAIWLIEVSYGLILKIADSNIFDETIFDVFRRRIYVLLAVFMLFKISLALVNYLVNPDDFSAKDKGFSKLVTNAIMVIVLLVSVPYLFKGAFYIQGEVLRSNALQKIILGVGSDMGSDEDETHKIVSYTIYSSLIRPNIEVTGIDCQNVILDENFTNSACSNSIEGLLDPNKADVFLIHIQNAINNKNSYKLLSDDVINATANGDFLLEYPFITVLIGGFTAVIFLGFVIDISVRAVKLSFLQLIAPIPIISYIDPKSGKDGMFKKWYKTTLTTFLDLFVRLIAVFFAIFMVKLMNSATTVSYSTGQELAWDNPLVKIFLLLGILMFAKQIPKLIEDITGFKMDGKFSINPMKKLNEIPGVGKGLATVGGIAAGAVAGHRVGAGFRGAAIGAFSGASSVPFMGSKDGKPAFTTGANHVYKNLMGKDFVNMSPSRLIAKIGAEQKINQVGDPTKVAYGELSKANTRLNIASNITTEESGKLRNAGVNISNLDNEKTRLQNERTSYSSASLNLKNRMTGASSSLSSMTSSYNTAKRAVDSGIVKPGDRSYNDLQKTISDYEKLKNESQRLTEEYNNSVQNISNIDGLLASINKYEGAIESENKIRGEIGKIEGEIKKLNTEKSQRERFYTHDPAPTGDVNKLVDKYNKIGEQNARNAQNNQNN